jgi:hypothetical protein
MFYPEAWTLSRTFQDVREQVSYLPVTGSQEGSHRLDTRDGSHQSHVRNRTNELLVVVTAGGRSVDAIPGPIPSNARIASYLPFEWLLPHVDAVVTNGGYGSVNQALSFGIPIVSAGLTEDKADVNARVLGPVSV